MRRLDELVGRADLLDRSKALEHWKAHGIDLSGLLSVPTLAPGTPLRRVRDQEPVLCDALDWNLIEHSKDALEHGGRVELERPVRNINRCVGGLLSGEIARRHGAAGLPEDSIDVSFVGSAGQSFGAWLARGVTFTLDGDANDYAGKGLSGGVLVVRPPADAAYVAEENVIVGNTVLYGATDGRAFFRGLAGERFAVRNSGAHAVVEGVGDHGCEYMTGGRVVVLGPTGRNFAAGMSGGIAYVYDETGDFAQRRCNRSSVSLRGARRGRRARAPRAGRRARAAHRLARRRAAAGRLGGEPRALRQGDAATTTAGSLDEQAALAGELAEVS